MVGCLFELGHVLVHLEKESKVDTLDGPAPEQGDSQEDPPWNEQEVGELNAAARPAVGAAY